MADTDITVDIDRFAVGLEQLLGDIPEDCGNELEKAVSQSTRRTAKKLRGEYTDGIGKHPWSGEYRGGFSSRVKKDGLMSEGEVGNKAKPGLVHLLEKGHATLTGRRTQAYPHMDPAFQDMSSDFIDRAEKAVERAIS